MKDEAATLFKLRASYTECN